MTHELKKIVQAGQLAAQEGKLAVLATVVSLKGSSYRRPGVRMLILEDQKTIGAVSGGCVEKEVVRQSASVFASGIPKVMTYDGRYRLGCEGILYILLEPFNPPEEFLGAFWKNINKREPFSICSHFDEKDHSDAAYGSVFLFHEGEQALRQGFKAGKQTTTFQEDMEPCFRLLILGAEHDAVQLCSFASLSGWEVVVVATPSEDKHPKDFPGVHQLVHAMPEDLDTTFIDDRTAVMLMTHSYVKDLKFLLAMRSCRPAYLGLLGPSTRRERLLNELLEHNPDLDDTFFDRIHGPSGLNIGAETPQEIAISILSEVLSVIRRKEPIPLRDKKGAIHH